MKMNHRQGVDQETVPVKSDEGFPAPKTHHHFTDGLRPAMGKPFMANAVK